MKNKPNDIPYLGCSKEKISSATPILDEEILRMLAYWVKERSYIHLKKDFYKLPKPWTEDRIFQTVRFTNVRRELDQESVYLINSICNNKELTLKQKLGNIIFFRIINKRESVQGILPLQFEQCCNIDAYRAYEESLGKDYPIFKKVYMISGSMRQIRNLFPDSSAFMSVIKYSWYLYNYKLSFIEDSNINAQDTFENLKSIPGIGSFLAYQIFVDLTYCPEYPCSENEFVVAGPGCKEGLKLLFKDRSKMSCEESLFWLRDNWENLIEYYHIELNPDIIFLDLPTYDHYMNVMSLQNCFCELLKYYRAYNGGFVIRHYKGV